MALRNNIAPSSGNLNGQTAGTVIAGNTVFLGSSYRKVSYLSARLALTAATASLTLSAKWQVSDDNSTWEDVANGSQNAAGVAVATGTSAQVIKHLPAPDTVYGKRYARVAIVTGVATGAAGDLYAIGYNYRQLTGAEGSI